MGVGVFSSVGVICGVVFVRIGRLRIGGVDLMLHL